MATSIPITISSYNCRGFNNFKRDYLKSFFESSSIVFLQEHWLSEDQFGLLGSICSLFSYTAISGFGTSDVLEGRPYGGCAIFWRSDLSVNVDIINTNSRRVCAIRMSNVSFRLLLICVYLPYEGSVDMTDEFVEQLALIENVIANNSDCQVIVGGDFNVDFHRCRLHTALLDSFCDNTGLQVALRHGLCDIDYTYNFDMCRFSILDHFLLSGLIFDESVNQISVLHSVDNISDHDPIVLHLALVCLHLIVNDRIFYPSISWHKANNEHLASYRKALSASLRDIELPVDALLCCDLHCHKTSHYQALNAFANDIIHGCISAGECAIPHTMSREESRCVPGWSDYVQPFRDKSMFWHKLWADCSRPRIGAVAEIMRRTRAAYHYAIRRVKRDEDAVIRERFAQALIDDNQRNLWSEVKRLRSHRPAPAKIVDGLSDAACIAKLFVSKYRDLYTSLLYDTSDMDNIMSELRTELLNGVASADCYFCPDEIKRAINKLKPHKKDGSASLSSDHFINAGDDCFVYISFLFSLITSHGTFPDCLKTCTLVPIPKKRNINSSYSANYRGIASSSVLGKIYDIIILTRYNDKLISSDLQFGFKAHHSTNHCTMVLKETIAYYTKNQTNVFCTFLDVSKAFDKVHYGKLFRLLIKRRLPVVIIRTLVNIYMGNFIRVNWCGVLSEYFLATNGVKQGGVLSPVLFCVYINDLLFALSDTGVGCHIGQFFLGALAYADDIVLTAPTVAAMRLLLKVCDNYATEYHISFNAEKSNCLVFRPKNCRHLSAPLYDNDNLFCIGNNPIKLANSYLHLGHSITTDLSDDDDIANSRFNFIGQANSVICFFGKLDPFVKFKLFRAYCTSFFGCELWSLSNEKINDVCVTWRKAVRRIWGLSNITHSYLLPFICGCLPLFDDICLRSLNFFRSCALHPSSLIRFVASHAIFSARHNSPLGHNVLSCMVRYDCSFDDIVSCHYKSIVRQYSYDALTDLQRANASLLFELISIRDGKFSLSNGLSFTKFELHDMINSVCTS